MKNSIRHLPGIEPATFRTTRLKTLVLAAGPEEGVPVMFLHGNLSAATFWEETMLALPKQFRAVAPDQRGFGLSNPSALVDATRGFADWADDAIALADFLSWERFHLVGHSLGGCVGWSLLGTQSPRLLSVTLVAPGPPCGFPGGFGPRGEPNHEDGAGSGAGAGAGAASAAGAAATEFWASSGVQSRAGTRRARARSLGGSFIGWAR